jgi:predicted phosphodiesterase
MRTVLLPGLLLAAASLPACTARTANASPTQVAERPAPARGSGWSFAILGDNRDDPDSVFPSIVQQIHAEGDLEFVVHLGDIVRSGGESQLRDFLNTSAPIRECFFPVIGNHEIRRDKDRRAFKAAFGLRSTSYSFTYRNAHVAVIDNASQEFSDGVLKWLRADLEKHRKGVGGIERLFVAMHIPPAGFGITTHVEGGKAQQFDAGSRTLLELLRAYSVDAIFAGHVHRAQTVDVPGGPQLVISGAAGAPQYLRLRPHYGYHRVTVNGAETRVEFVEVNKGQNAPVEHAHSRQATCPKIDDADGG